MNCCYPVRYCWLPLASLVLLGVLLFGACAVLQGPPDTDMFIFLDESEPLYVEFFYSADPRLTMDFPDVADYTEERRRFDYMVCMQQVLADVRLPLEVHLLGQYERAGPGPVLQLMTYCWESDGYFGVRVVVSAKLSRYGELNTLGTFSASDQGSDAAYRGVMYRALLDMMGELMKHFMTPEDEVFIYGAVQP